MSIYFLFHVCNLILLSPSTLYHVLFPNSEALVSCFLSFIQKTFLTTSDSCLLSVKYYLSGHLTLQSEAHHLDEKASHPQGNSDGTKAPPSFTIL